MPLPNLLAASARRFYASPFFLLLFTTFFWAGNVVAGRLAVGEVSPMAVVFLRWFFAFGLLVAFFGPTLRTELPRALPHWPQLLLMGILGFTAFNALYYSAAHLTNGINIAIIQGSTPIVVLLTGFVALGQRMTLLQLVGAVITIFGVMVSASHGDWRVIAGLAFNQGDLFIFIASLFYAGYTLLLRRRPDVSAITFFAAMALAACLSALPLVIWEWLSERFVWPGWKGWLIIAYIAILPSLICQVFYIRAVEIAGAGRASVYYNLVPVFGVLLSNMLLGETLALADFAALALVLGGIAIAERGKPA